MLVLKFSAVRLRSSQIYSATIAKVALALLLSACGQSASSPAGDPAAASGVGGVGMAATGFGGASSSLGLGGVAASSGGSAVMAGLSGGSSAMPTSGGGQPGMGGARANGGQANVPVALKGFVYKEDPWPLSSADPTLLADKLSALHVDWFYTWGRLRPAAVPISLPFAPMIWGHQARNAEVLDHALSQLQQPGLDDALLGFNEPDRPDQANFTVEEALLRWPDLMATGRRLGSPATAENALTGTWFPAFMQGIRDKGLRVDFIAVHRYASPNPQSFLDYLDAVHALYQLPIWITEFAVADWNATATTPNKYSVADVEAFLRTIVPEFRKRPFVERFSWKTRHTTDVNMGTSALFNEDGSLTEVGAVYAGL